MTLYVKITWSRIWLYLSGSNEAWITSFVSFSGFWGPSTQIHIHQKCNLHTWHCSSGTRDHDVQSHVWRSQCWLMSIWVVDNNSVRRINFILWCRSYSVKDSISRPHYFEDNSPRSVNYLSRACKSGFHESIVWRRLVRYIIIYERLIDNLRCTTNNMLNNVYNRVLEIYL